MAKLLLLHSPIVLAIAIALIITSSQGQLIPNGFSCGRDMPRKSDIYSTPPNSNSIKVDLIHILCGQVDSDGASGFHARPGNVDPPSASTTNALQSRTPRNEYDFSMYRNAGVYDSYSGRYITKRVSSIWPTVLSAENIVWIITYLVDQCRYVRIILCAMRLLCFIALFLSLHH